MHLIPDVEKRSSYNILKKKVYDLLDPRMNTGWGHIVNLVIISMIVLNTLAVILETVDYFNRHYHTYLRAFDMFSLVLHVLYNTSGRKRA